MITLTKLEVVLEAKLSRRMDWDPIFWFNPDAWLCLSQARTWISNDICRAHFFPSFCCVFSEL